MNLNIKKALLFDMDGVLADTNPTHRIAFKNYLASKNIDCTDAFFDQYIAGNHNQQIFKNVFGNEITHEQITTYSYEKELLFRQLYKPIAEPMNGVIAFLKKMQDQHKLMAVCTSAPKENLDFILDELELKSYFNVQLCEQDVTAFKPNGQIYTKAMGLLGVTAAESIVFEDSDIGVRAGIHAGCPVVVVNNSKLNYPEIAAHIHDFTDLLTLY
jgi:beta-phosphoglucomutase